MPGFRVAWETFLGLVTGEDLLTGTHPPPDAGGNGSRRHGRRVSPEMLARLQARSRRTMRGRVGMPLPARKPTPPAATVAADEPDGAETIHALRTLNLL